MSGDLEYHEARAGQEAEAAEASTVPEAALAHRKMANEHARYAHALRTQEDDANHNGNADRGAFFNPVKETSNG